MMVKRLKKNRGSALIWAILLMLVLSIFSLAVTFLVKNNNNLSIRSVNLLRTRHIAEAGIEVGYATLTAQSESNPYYMVIKELKAADLPRIHSEKIYIDGAPIGRFNATISLDVSEPGKTWVVVTSQGKLNHSDLVVERTLKINKNNIKDVQRYETIQEK